MRMFRLGIDLCRELFFRRRRHMECGVHAEGGLGSASSTRSISGLGMLSLSSLLERVEVRDTDASGRLAVHAALDESGLSHMSSWDRALVPREVRAAGISLSLLTWRACQAGEIGMLGDHCFSHD